MCFAMENKLLSLEQVASHLGVHRDTVYKLVRSGRLPALQLGGRKAGWRVAEEDLQKFIDDGKAATVAITGEDDEAKLQAFDDSQLKEMAQFQATQAAKRTEFVREQHR
jgi:excisionase family DNA binding protein